MGLVVGATAPRELAAIRAIAPGLGFLVPGVGAQGGEVDPVLRDGRAAAPPAGTHPGRGLLVNVSRGIAAAATVGAPARRRRVLAGTPRSASRRPLPAGRAGCLCYPSRRSRRFVRPTRFPSAMPFNIQGPELIILLVIALLVLGPGKLPEVGSALGKSIREFRKAATDVKDAASIEPAKAAAAAPAEPPPLVTSPPPCRGGVQLLPSQSPPRRSRPARTRRPPSRTRPPDPTRTAE